MTSGQRNDDNLAINAIRRMPDYRGAAESRPQPRSTLSDMGAEAEKMQRILSHHADISIKIGARTFMTLDEPEYGEWTPHDGREWHEHELPIGHHALRAVSGILLDLKKVKDKLNLAAAAPEFVLQMYVQASKDYKLLLDEPMKVVRSALLDYVRYLKTPVEDENEDEKFTLEEITILSSDVGMASLAGSPEFEDFFLKWQKGGFIPPEGGKTFVPSGSIARAFQRQLVEPSRLATALNIVRDLGTFDLNDQSSINFDLAHDLGLNTKFKPGVTRIEAYIMQDPNFRYFVDGAGGGKGSRVYYWDWVRNSAEKAGLARSQF